MQPILSTDSKSVKNYNTKDNYKTVSHIISILSIHQSPLSLGTHTRNKNSFARNHVSVIKEVEYTKNNADGIIAASINIKRKRRAEALHVLQERKKATLLGSNPDRYYFRFLRASIVIPDFHWLNVLNPNVRIHVGKTGLSNFNLKFRASGNKAVS
jgi:hypothetical protein